MRILLRRCVAKASVFPQMVEGLPGPIAASRLNNETLLVKVNAYSCHDFLLVADFRLYAVRTASRNTVFRTFFSSINVAPAAPHALGTA